MGIFRNTDRKITKCVEEENVMVISSREDIISLKNVRGIVHICFRPSNMDIFEIVRLCPNMKMIQIPGSYMKSISDSVKIFLDMQGIILREGTIQRTNQ